MSEVESLASRSTQLGTRWVRGRVRGSVPRDGDGRVRSGLQRGGSSALCAIDGVGLATAGIASNGRSALSASKVIPAVELGETAKYRYDALHHAGSTFGTPFALAGAVASTGISAHAGDPVC